MRAVARRPSRWRRPPRPSRRSGSWKRRSAGYRLTTRKSGLTTSRSGCHARHARGSTCREQSAQDSVRHVSHVRKRDISKELQYAEEQRLKKEGRKKEKRR